MHVPTFFFLKELPILIYIIW